MCLALILVILLSSCRSRTTCKYHKIIHLRGLNYLFSDNGNRGLKIVFSTDTTLEVSNRSSISHNFYLVSFDAQYLYTRNEIGTVVVRKKIKSSKDLQKSGYVKPYDGRGYPMDSLAYRYIFPDIEGDTLRFSSDFKRLQVREFCFERIK